MAVGWCEFAEYISRNGAKYIAERFAFQRSFDSLSGTWLKELWNCEPQQMWCGVSSDIVQSFVE